MRRFTLAVMITIMTVPAISCNRRGVSEPKFPDHLTPAMEIPQQVVIKSGELGTVAVAEFMVSNRGQAELVIDAIETNCSCLRIEQRHGSEFVRIHSLRLAPGESAALRVSISIRGVPVGASMTNNIGFHTNDPSHPHHRLQAVISQVTGGVFTQPSTLIVGSLRVGASAHYYLDVRDDAVTPRKLERVVSSQPDHVSVRILPDHEAGQDLSAGSGFRIARLEVSVNTDHPGDVNATLSLQLVEGRATPDAVRVTGRVLASVEVSPSSLVLPRSSPEGKVYTANCQVRSTSGLPLTIEVVSCPNYLAVTTHASEANEALSLLTVELDSKAVVIRPITGTIRVRCHTAQQEVILEITVLISP